jgi:uncharacterized protein (TIGR02996 family)
MSLCSALEKASTSAVVATVLQVASAKEFLEPDVRRTLLTLARNMEGCKTTILAVLDNRRRWNSEPADLQQERDAFARQIQGVVVRDVQEADAQNSPPEESLLLAAACAAPGNIAPWQVYADWLEERGEDTAWLRSERFLALWRDIPASYQRQQVAFDFARVGGHLPAAIPPPPSLTAVLRSFFLAQWRVLEHLETPRLILCPPIGFSSWRALLDRHPQTSLSTDCTLHMMYEQPPPPGWQAFFIDGEQNMPVLRREERERLTQEAEQRADHVARMALAKRLEAEEQSRPAHLEGMDRLRYSALMFDSLERKEPIDTKTQTLLNGDRQDIANYWTPVGGFSIVNYWTPVGGFSTDRQVRFLLADADNRDRRARVRRAVRGDVVA